MTARLALASLSRSLALDRSASIRSPSSRRRASVMASAAEAARASAALSPTLALWSWKRKDQEDGASVAPSVRSRVRPANPSSGPVTGRRVKDRDPGQSISRITVPSRLSCAERSAAAWRAAASSSLSPKGGGGLYEVESYFLKRKPNNSFRSKGVWSFGMGSMGNLLPGSLWKVFGRDR